LDTAGWLPFIARDVRIDSPCFALWMKEPI
jgi:hypothetical protein